MRNVFAGLTLALALLVAAPASGATFAFGPLEQVSPSQSPFGSTASGAPCQGAPQSGTNYPGSEVEPWVAANPTNKQQLVGAWQQDRWSNGGSNGLLAAYSTDGGASWTQSAFPPFTRCTGGTFERASDPWTTVSPDGTAYVMGLSFNDSNPTNGMQVSQSGDGGATWGAATTLRLDTSANVLDDKNSITADRFDSNYVYAIWDRLVFPNARSSKRSGENAIGYRGPTWFSRTTDHGASWETARMIYDPGEVNQTIGNQIVQLGNGTLVDTFDLIYNEKNAHKVRGYNVAAMRSTDHGATWSKVKIVSPLRSNGVPGARTGDIIPEVAADPRPGSKTFYIVWQDASLGDGVHDAIAFTQCTSGASISCSAPTAINTRTDVSAFTPAIRVADDGTVVVTHYDLRNATDAQPLLTDSWQLHRHPGGAWTEDHVSGPFDMATAANAGGRFLGDYEGLEARGGDGSSGEQSIPFFAKSDTGQAEDPSDIEATTGND